LSAGVSEITLEDEVIDPVLDLDEASRVVLLERLEIVPFFLINKI
jgi:hypothetical protein